jgi:hypothetical protein
LKLKPERERESLGVAVRDTTFGVSACMLHLTTVGKGQGNIDNKRGMIIVRLYKNKVERSN